MDWLDRQEVSFVIRNRARTHLIVSESDSTANMYIGNRSDYETMLQEKSGKDLTLHRVKYGTLNR